MKRMFLLAIGVLPLIAVAQTSMTAVRGGPGPLPAETAAAIRHAGQAVLGAKGSFVEDSQILAARAAIIELRDTIDAERNAGPQLPRLATAEPGSEPLAVAPGAVRPLARARLWSNLDQHREALRARRASLEARPSAGSADDPIQVSRAQAAIGKLAELDQELAALQSGTDEERSERLIRLRERLEPRKRAPQSERSDTRTLDTPTISTIVAHRR